MPASTPDNLIPYMVDSDPLADVASIMQDLAERVEKLTPITGRATCTLVGAASGAANITFPAGKFATPPRVFTTIESGSTAYASYVSVTSATAATVRVRHVDGTAASTSIDVQWVAIDVDE
jgi:hypothetical protein